MDKIVKAIVNHTGSCAGIRYEAEKAFDVMESVYNELKKALGDDIRLVSQVVAQAEQTVVRQANIAADAAKAAAEAIKQGEARK